MQGKKFMKPSDLVLRCYAERESDGAWFAICLDLNLTARGNTAHEARQKLHERVVRYVTEALTVDREYFQDLVPRRAPLEFFVRYYVIKALCALRGLRREREAKRIFNEHLPVVPA